MTTTLEMRFHCLIRVCLVTKYTGPNSFIPEYSDNERASHPDSSIFTVSLGFDATVQIRHVHSGDVRDQHIKSGSLYAMTRASQDLFKHSIAKNQSLSESETRISLTFRSLHWRSNNSTLIVGDSNTGGLKFSSFGKDVPVTVMGHLVTPCQVNEWLHSRWNNWIL